MRGAEKLNIRWTQGYKGENDRRYFIANVVVTIRDTLRWVQFIAENEKRIHSDTIKRTGHFFFKEAIIDALDGMDIDAICKKYLIPQRGNEVESDITL